jgi:RNA polymerase sigma factor (sigma-70 family)
MAESETSQDEGDEESALILAAAAGDRRAAGEYFARTLPRLSAIARRVAGTSHDPGDLLGDALVIILSKWAQGTGPTDFVPAYIAQTMRNRMKDDFKSPRSKVRYFDEDDDPEAREDPRIRRVEIAAELALIRRAMAELPEDQQLILTATIVEGLKPSDLQERLARPMTAIYSLSHRARANLRRATLRLILEEDANPECYAAAQHLPEQVENSPDDIRGSRFTVHYKTCRRCRRAWARFGALSTLGLAPLLVIGDLLLGVPAPAQASDDDQNDDDQTQSDQPGSSQPGSSPSGSQPGFPSSGQASAGPPPAPSVAPSAQPAPGSSGANSAPSASPAPAVTRLAVSAAVAASAIGAAILVFLAVAFVTQTFWFTPEPTASLSVQAETPSVSLTRLDVDFDIDGESWTIRTARLVLSEPAAVQEAPDGWTCEALGRVVTCTTAQIDADGGVITLAHAPSIARLKYDLEIVAVTDSGATVVGTYGDTVVR